MKSRVMFHVRKATKLTEIYKAAYELLRKRNPEMRVNIDANYSYRH